MEAENDDSPIDLEEASTEVDAQPNKQRKMSDLDTPRRRGNLTLKGLLPMPVNLASRKRKEEARLRKMVCVHPFLPIAALIFPPKAPGSVKEGQQATSKEGEKASVRPSFLSEGSLATLPAHTRTYLVEYGQHLLS